MPFSPLSPLAFVAMELPLEDAIATKLIGDEGPPRLASRHWRRGFEIGDIVWGKVKSHPWWPGYNFSEAFAAPSVQRSKREGNILVAFYGDSSYGWLDPDDLVHFEPTFAEKSLQTNVKNFIEAVKEAVDEVMWRSALGLIKKARKSFLPKETLDFMRKLALKPRSKVRQDLSFVKKKATALAYRKAVFEEDDPTYAEAFGITPSKQSQEVAHPFGQPSSIALLSGPSNNVKHTSSLKPQKNPAKPDDPTTKGEHKRGSSDRQEEIAAKKKKKKINDVRALAAQKKASAKTSEVQPGDSKEIPAKKLVSTPVKSSKPGSGQKEPAEKVPDPAILVMKFPHNGSLPSVPELNAKFARFGALDHSATRVFCKSSTCRLVYQFRDHAVQA
ncbi:hypothetical protein BC332_10552 [Capsicum chinense]|nr:hypothetical protein BC332_10552 [Capsicum chinense]